MRLHLILAIAALTLAAGAAGAQQPPPGVRVVGAVKSVSASDLVLTTAQGDVDVALAPQTRVLARQAADAGEIKPGAYLGTANQNGADSGAGTATEVHLMDNGPNVNVAMNNSGLMMTNGHVKSVTATPAGEEMDVDYGQAATRHVVVPKDATVTRMVEVGIAALKPGVQVTANTIQATDGKPTANFILVGPAPKPGS